MTLRPAELEDACAEAAAALVGRPVQKVVQPDASTVLLGFPSRWLLVSVDARAGRLHLVEEKPAGTGEAATAFCMLLRKLLVGARLVAVAAVPGERACALEFLRSAGAPPKDGGAEGPVSVRRRMIALLYGAGGRLGVVDAPEHGGGSKSASGGAIRAQGEGDVLGATGPGRATALALPPPRQDDRPSRFPSPAPSAAIAAHYSALVEKSGLDAARTRALVSARKALDKLRRRQEALRGDLARAERAADRRRHADLLLAHLAEIPRGAREVVLPDDFSTGEPIAIALDPALGPKENVARLYREHQRMARGRASIEARLAETHDEIARAERAVARCEAGELPPPLSAPSPTKRAARGRPGAKRPYREFRSASGVAILVGRGADKNDDLTFHVARGGDLWLHTRDVPGAHVVVPTGGAPVDQETLLDAATLAVHHSPARQERQADVTYAARKHVRKPRGAKPGLVTVAGGKTLRIRMEPERLRRLLASRLED